MLRLWLVVVVIGLVRGVVREDWQQMELMEGGRVVLAWHWGDGQLNFTLVSLALLWHFNSSDPFGQLLMNE